IFILEALVRGELNTRAGFLEHNQNVREEVELLEHKRRKHDVLADEHAQFEFFDARVPEGVNSSSSFEKWLRQLGEEGRKCLYLGHEVLMREDAATAPADQFPDVLDSGSNRFELSYHFEPGHPADGVTMQVPLELLNTLDLGELQWLVPGLLRDKLIALIRGLPKPRRRLLTPVPVFADALLDTLQQQKRRPLYEACASELSRMTGVDFSVSDFDGQAMPPHLQFYIQVTGSKGQVVAEGRDLAALQEELGVIAQRRFMDRQGAGYNRDGLLTWEAGDLPKSLITRNKREAWPALVDQDNAVGLRLFDTAEEAAAAHREGVLRLLELGLADKFQFLRKHPGLSRESLMAWTPMGSAESLVTDLLHSSLQRAAGSAGEVRTETQFDQMLNQVRAKLGLECRKQADLLNELLPHYRRIQAELGKPWAKPHQQAVEDISWQLEDLVYEGFLSHLTPGRLDQYPRYLEAIEERLAGLRENPGRDRQRMELVLPWWSKYLDYLEQQGVYDHALDVYRWLVEEYRVSLFAQKLGTAEKVSPKRLDAAWQNVRSNSVTRP
ncbi:MAG TPA: DUF3418 domain-containing protein, partial [Xanthomonadales bacterium]|nr:DUF3418 domain-containing protein [Xanthomonadales bacterium]